MNTLDLIKIAFVTGFVKAAEPVPGKITVTPTLQQPPKQTAPMLWAGDSRARPVSTGLKPAPARPQMPPARPRTMTGPGVLAPSPPVAPQVKPLYRDPVSVPVSTPRPDMGNYLRAMLGYNTLPLNRVR